MRNAIKRAGGHPTIRKHPRDALMVEVLITLDQVPPREWQDILQHHPGIHVPWMRLDGQNLIVEANKGEEDDAIREADERIARTNREYEVSFSRA